MHELHWIYLSQIISLQLTKLLLQEPISSQNKALQLHICTELHIHLPGINGAFPFFLQQELRTWIFDFSNLPQNATEYAGKLFIIES